MAIEEDKINNPELLREKLRFFKRQFDELPAALKKNLTWEVLEKRLLADEGHDLKVAAEMNRGGLLFGVDKLGNALVADAGKGPIMKGLKYPDARRKVMFKHEGRKMLQEDGVPVPTGYELFPYDGKRDKSEEMKMFEFAAGHQFVEMKDSATYGACASWLESGKNSQYPKRAEEFGGSLGRK